MKKLVALLAIASVSLSACGGEVDESGEADAATGASAVAAGDLDFGDDSGPYASDDECDDARFVGDGMAMGLNTDFIGRDASDCAAMFADGRVSLNPLFEDATNYGDDSGSFANNGECDDIRFTGAYADGMIYLPEDIGTDASDCRAAVESGEARWQGPTATPERGVTEAELQQMDI